MTLDAHTQVVCQPGSITGGISATMVKIDASGYSRKQHADVLSVGIGADAVTALRPLSKAQITTLSTLVDETYAEALRKLANGRCMTFRRVTAACGQGRTWTGVQVCIGRFAIFCSNVLMLFVFWQLL